MYDNGGNEQQPQNYNNNDDDVADEYNGNNIIKTPVHVRVSLNMSTIRTEKHKNKKILETILLSLCHFIYFSS